MIQMIFAQNHIHDDTFSSHYPPMIACILVDLTRGLKFYLMHSMRGTSYQNVTYLHRFCSSEKYCANSLVGLSWGNANYGGCGVWKYLN